ncbi:MAG: class I SAM-dependent methyltransferase [bacterium]|jgi:SAM-dependent methyltransferase
MIEYLITKYLKGYTAKSILDIGPGYARITGADQITYVDCDLSVLNWQITECQKEGLEAKPILMLLSKESIENPEDKYDLILCQEVLEHLSDAEDVLFTLTQRLSDCGKIIITVPTKVSENWLKFLNSDYMRKDSFCGHIRDISRSDLLRMLDSVGLVPLIIFSTKPHYFIFHTWLFVTRTPVDVATGRLLSTGIRTKIGIKLLLITKKLFMMTNMHWWGKRLPRNYFVIAQKNDYQMRL